MSVEKIKQARQLLELGEISQETFDQIKAAAMEEMGMNTLPPKPDVLGFETKVDGASATLSPFGGGMFDGETKVGAEGLEIGQYRVLNLLGQGGMGSVYRGRHKNDVMADAEGDVAIKLIKPELAKDPSLRTRFVKEAALGKKIVHPNIGKVITYHEDSNHTAFIMEYIEGDDLKSLIPAKGFELNKALSLLRPLAEAIDFLHSKGVIHRDLKPANIKIRLDGSPVILDFGIAKEENAESGSMTKTGTTMGTDAYMAPEQMNAKAVGPKADQYSFAMIVYEMLSGRLPWDSGTTSAMITVAKMTSGLKPLEAVCSLDDRYGKVVSRGLSIESTSRYDTCVTLVDALEQAGQGPSPEELARIEAERVEHEHLAELEREKVESERRIQAERERQVETAKREAEEARKAEEARQIEMKRQVEAARKAEEAKKAKEIKNTPQKQLGRKRESHKEKTNKSKKNELKDTSTTLKQTNFNKVYLGLIALTITIGAIMSVPQLFSYENSPSGVESSIDCSKIDGSYNLSTVVLKQKPDDSGKKTGLGINGFYELRIQTVSESLVKKKSECEWSLNIEKIGWGNSKKLNLQYMRSTSSLKHHQGSWWKAEIAFEKLSMDIVFAFEESFDDVKSLEGIWYYTQKSWKVNHYNGTFLANKSAFGGSQASDFPHHTRRTELSDIIQKIFSQCEPREESLQCYY